MVGGGWGLLELGLTASMFGKPLGALQGALPTGGPTMGQMFDSAARFAGAHPYLTGAGILAIGTGMVGTTSEAEV